MAVNFRLPKISGSTEEQLSQIRSFLYRLTEELNYAFFNSGSNEALPSSPSAQNIGTAVKFSEIKTLIIKNNDIIDAYFAAIDDRLRRKYVAESGERGGWTYDKRTDGTYEAWGTFDAQVTESSGSGGVFITNTILVPTPFPVTDAIITGSCEGYAWLCRCNVKDPDTEECAVSFALTSGVEFDTNIKHKVSLMIRGRWNNINPSEGEQNGE